MIDWCLNDDDWMYYRMIDILDCVRLKESSGLMMEYMQLWLMEDFRYIYLNYIYWILHWLMGALMLMLDSISSQSDIQFGSV